eukprot:TRINITY_DN4368_c0_g1_i1.p1 TRINITY_DN4368_c0_g1~~TRINITY_DN4368_c0_g1_i1.p1  ORF type:complete len:589 (+),score=101.04 TRINITY_DN4368_c0_g1_i1:777-2543(+)
MPRESFIEYNTLQDHQSWSIITNLDSFLIHAYNYYIGKGLVCIFVADLCLLLQSAFVAAFTIFLTFCVDYHILFKTQMLSNAVEFDISRHPRLFFALSLVFSVILFWRLINVFLKLKSNLEMKHFYTQIGISEKELQTIEWNEIVSLIGKSPPIKELIGKEIDQLDVANRIMRWDNYLLASIHKEVITFDVEIPCFGTYKAGSALTEDCLRFLIFDYLFKDYQTLKPEVLLAKRGTSYLFNLTRGLQRRFLIAGVIALVALPPLLVVWILYVFLRYGEEAIKSPSALIKRRWSPVARWKFREYNELSHYFEQRLQEAYEPTVKYIKLYPKPLEEILAKFFSFILGAFLAVLLVIIFLDKEFATELVVFGDFNAILFAGILGTALAICRGFIAEPTFYKPKETLELVLRLTHYLPSQTPASCHQIVEDLCELLEPRFGGFIREIISLLLTPVFLLITLPKRAQQIITFFNECTERVGDNEHVCTYSRFSFNEKEDVAEKISGDEEENETTHTKMEKSFFYFKELYPEWVPSENGQRLLESFRTDPPSLRTSAEYLNSSFFRSSTESLTDPSPLSQVLAEDLNKKVYFKK